MAIRLPVDWDGIIPDENVDFSEWLAVGSTKAVTHIAFDVSVGTNFTLVWEASKDTETGVNLDTDSAVLRSLGNGVFSLANMIRPLGAYYRVHPSNDQFQIVEGMLGLGGTVSGGGGGGGVGTGDILFTWAEYEFGHDGNPAHAVQGAVVAAYNNSTATGDPVASGVTDELGQVKFYLNEGTYYLFRRKAGRAFTNPVTIEVS